MFLEIITPEKNLYTGKVNSIILPGIDGQFGILENHAPIISILIKGVITITENNEKIKKFEIDGGVIEMKNNHTTILVE
tara:strand:- start:10699 stop:10935 length:237 start_codon:yes stop_codon:yes gene_type:complete